MSSRREYSNHAYSKRTSFQDLGSWLGRLFLVPSGCFVVMDRDLKTGGFCINYSLCDDNCMLESVLSIYLMVVERSWVSDSSSFSESTWNQDASLSFRFTVSTDSIVFWSLFCVHCQYLLEHYTLWHALWPCSFQQCLK
jgi:hypothetical protein